MPDKREATKEIGRRKPTDIFPPKKIAKIGIITLLAPGIPAFAIPVNSTLKQMTIIVPKVNSSI